MNTNNVVFGLGGVFTAAALAAPPVGLFLGGVFGWAMDGAVKGSFIDLDKKSGSTPAAP